MQLDDFIGTRVVVVSMYTRAPNASDTVNAKMPHRSGRVFTGTEASVSARLVLADRPTIPMRFWF